MESTASKNKGGYQSWREKSQFGRDIHAAKKKKHLPLAKRWLHQVKDRMRSTDVTFRKGPGSKAQLGRTRKMQDVEVEWPGERLRRQARPCPCPGTAWAVWSPSLCTCVTTHSLGIFFFSILRKRQPEFSPTSQCPSAHVQLWKSPHCSECVREAAWKIEWFAPCFLSPGCFYFLTWKQKWCMPSRTRNHYVPWFARLP